MSYQDKEIKTIMEEIRENKIYLPAIQRKLVWKHEQIEKLFDSVMRGYPIGTFLFWKLKGESINNYTFYKFIQEYKKEITKNEIAAKPDSRNEITGVLDGQQRLNSMYIALQGSYAYKKPHARWSNPDAFPKRHLYLNLLYDNESNSEDLFDICEECGYDKVPQDSTKCPNCGVSFDEEEESGIKFEFKFLTKEEKDEIDKDTFWFPVKEVLTWKDSTYVDEFCEECIEKEVKLLEILKDKDKKKLFRRNLFLLWQRIVTDKVISYFEVEETDLDNISDIFVRVNSGGTPLSKTDLLFSTIVANWEDARDEVERLLEVINKKGDGFNFNNDFIMRACLVLTDCNVLFKVQTFKKENISVIKKEWENIKFSIEKTVEIISEFGYNRDTLTSQMAIIPITYFLMKKGPNYRLNESNKAHIRHYLISALLKQVYGGQGDQILGKIRDLLRKEVNNEGVIEYCLAFEEFPLKEIIESNLPSNKSFKFVEKDIDDILSYKKGAYTFMILSLLYPNLKYGHIKFHQDHLHPKSMFTTSKLSKLNIPEEKQEDWREICDTLPNLQLLEGAENESKNKTPLSEWFDKNVKDKIKYQVDNYFPDEVDLNILNFSTFYAKRRDIIKEKIIQILTITPSSNINNNPQLKTLLP